MSVSPNKKSKSPAALPTPLVAPTANRPSPKSRKLKGTMMTVLILILAGGVGFFAYKYHQANDQAKLLADPKTAAAQQTNQLVSQVGKLVVLPSGEKPTVATVTDIAKLKGQAFFTSAQNGDKVLIYTQAKKAVLYRPSQNKVLEIAPLNIGDSAQESASAPATTNSTSSP